LAGDKKKVGVPLLQKLKKSIMKKLLLISILNLSWIFSIAQTTFEKSFGGSNNDSAACVRKTMDGGYIICGSTKSFGAGNYDVYIVKINADGSKSWTKTFGGSGSDYGRSIQQTADSGYVITGSSNSFNFGDNNVYLIKTDVNGDLMWSETIGGFGDDGGNSVIETSDGGYAVTGFSEVMGHKTVYLLKTLPDGTRIFESNLASEGEGNSILQAADGGFVINGTIRELTDSLNKQILIKTNEYGFSQWAKTFQNNYSCSGSSLLQNADGGYTIGGSTGKSVSNAPAAYMIVTDSLGERLWSKAYNAGEGVSLQYTFDRGYIMSGKYDSGTGNDIYLTKTDSAGNVTWTKTFGGVNNDFPIGAYQSNDAGYIIAGTTSSFGGGNYDMYLIKTDNAGNTLCSNNSISTIDSVMTFSENSYIFQLTFVSFIPEVTIPLTSSMNVNTTSNTVCAPPASPLSGLDAVSSNVLIDTDSIGTNDSTLVPPSNAGTEPGEQREEVVYQNNDDQGNKTTTSVMSSESKADEFNVFPNPTDGSNINISINTDKAQEVLVVVYDELGRESYSKVVFTGEDADNTFAIDPSGKLKPGMYMITATSEKNKFIKRLIVK
jgi:hypothetical protein